MRASIPAKFVTRMDMAGMGLSVACAVHCLVTPVLLSAVPFFGLSFIGHEGFESGMIAGVAILAGFTFINGHRIHGRKIHFAIGAAGLAVFLLVRPFVGEALEPYATLVGGSAFVLGHFLNWKWSKPCATC